MRGTLRRYGSFREVGGIIRCEGAEGNFCCGWKSGGRSEGVGRIIEVRRVLAEEEGAEWNELCRCPL